MTDNDFTFMTSTQLGAPQMNGSTTSNGQLLQVLDGALIDGFNQLTPTSLTYDTSSVVLTYAENHGYQKKQLILISGATLAVLNGRHRISSTTDKTVTIKIVGVTDVTGVITTKVAPLGFESMFGSSDPLKRAYRSSNTLGTRTVLYLDMTILPAHGYAATNPAKRAIVSMCEDMTVLGVQQNSYTDAKNNFTKNPTGSLFWYQSRFVNKTTAVTSEKNNQWIIAGNRDFFVLIQDWHTFDPAAGLYKDIYMFGDVESYGGASDRYNCIWLGSMTENDADTDVRYASNGGRFGGNPAVALQVQGYFISDYTGVSALDPMCLTISGLVGAVSSGMSITASPYTSFIPEYPNAISSGIVTTSVYALTKTGYRARIPCLLCIPMGMGELPTYNMTWMGDVFLSAVHGQRSVSSASTGYVAVDPTGEL